MKLYTFPVTAKDLNDPLSIHNRVAGYGDSETEAFQDALHYWKHYFNIERNSTSSRPVNTAELELIKHRIQP
jgi:hypothetical protein